MKKLILFSLSLLLVGLLAAFGQKTPSAKFKNTEYDYGNIKEEDGKKQGKFEFSNAGDDTLKILNVKPGCGCTAVEYTKGPVLPGEEGSITVSFDPSKRPGPFSKAIDVTTNDPANARVILVVKGEVLPKPRTVADDFPHLAGNLRLSVSQFMLQSMHDTDVKTDTIKMYNESKQTIEISFPELPAYATVKAVPDKLKPAEKGYIVLKYDAAKRGEYGYIYDRFKMMTNDELLPEKNVAVSVNITEDFSKLTPEQLASAPVINFSTMSHQFPSVKSGEKVEFDFKFTNSGQRDLIIRKVKGTSGYITYILDKTTYKPGETGAVHAIFNTVGKSGRQSQGLNVITNDPKNSNIRLVLEGDITQ